MSARATRMCAATFMYPLIFTATSLFIMRERLQNRTIKGKKRLDLDFEVSETCVMHTTKKQLFSLIKTKPNPLLKL